MRRLRSSGVLLHVTSLPGRGGIGDLGSAARQFVEFLREAAQSLWQVLPIGPTGFGNSPYQSPSSFAGNPLLVSPENLVSAGLLLEQDVAALWDEFPEDELSDIVDFDRLEPLRLRLLRQASNRYFREATADDRQKFDDFRAREAWWLDDFTLFMALKRAHGGAPWTEWEVALRERNADAMSQGRERLQEEVQFEEFIQFQFDQQWEELRQFAGRRGVRLFGDLPIFVAHDSADVWANQELFSLNEQGQSLLVAGVPPDYFCETGQLWGNPLYRWDVHAAQGYRWWIERLRRSFSLFDMLRIDHFRGFEAHWEIPADAQDARAGRWVHGPGTELFRAAEAALGEKLVVAEDLGVITAGVEKMRDTLGFPGMRVLQFAFGDDPKGPDYRPHNFVRNCVVYTGTHDNDTTIGWFHSQAGQGTTRTAEQIRRECRFALAYLGTDGREIHWDMIRLALGSIADTAIIPLQDILGLGSEARMNRPGTSTGNWSWRVMPSALTSDIALRLAELTRLYDRNGTAAPLAGQTDACPELSGSRGV